jgi:hypothetical protein
MTSRGPFHGDTAKSAESLACSIDDKSAIVVVSRAIDDKYFWDPYNRRSSCQVRRVFDVAVLVIAVGESCLLDLSAAS